MSGTSSIPTTTSDVTAEWLTDALRQSGTIGREATVSSVDVVPGAAGVGFMGEVGKVALAYTGDARQAPATMMVKFPTQSPEITAMMKPTRVYEREHRFYDELADTTPLRTPATYHITCNASMEDDEDYLLLMEDFGDMTLGDQVAGVSVDQARAALVGLAGHHARFWNGAGLENAPYVPEINGLLNRAGQSIYTASLPGFKEAFGDVLTDEMVPVAEAYADAHPRILDRLAAMPNTLVHFDFRADNLFFDDDGTVAVIDWQAISKGGGAADVGYFLSQNLSIEDRRAHEDDLLHTYHDTLTASGVTDYTFESFFDDYRLGVMYGWIIPVFAVGSLDFTSERAVALWTAVIDRVQTAIADLGAAEFVR